MRYMMMVYMDEAAWEALPAADRDRVKGEADAYHRTLVDSGHALSGAALFGTATATTLRERDGKLVTTDGPFAETKEVLAGYQILQCKDLDEACAIGARFPGFRAGISIEIRPVRDTGAEGSAPA